MSYNPGYQSVLKELKQSTETLFLPPRMALYASCHSNFLAYKAMAGLMWAHVRYGTFSRDLQPVCDGYPDPVRALSILAELETVRLEARIAAVLPGLAREIGTLRDPGHAPDPRCVVLADAGATVTDKRLRPDEFVLSTDEKTSIQARIRKHPSSPPRPHCAARVEHEYARGGAWAYLAALDVHRAKVFGRCEQTTGIEPFGRLVAQVMAQPPYRNARRVFWIMDNGSSHRGQPCVRRLTRAFPNLVPVHGPVHASWLNQIEIYFSIVQRKALTPNDFSCLQQVEERLLRFQEYYESMATPFDWRFTRDDLDKLTKKFATELTPLRLAA
jgi:hypothetical protein